MIFLYFFKGFFYLIFYIIIRGDFVLYIKKYYRKIIIIIIPLIIMLLILFYILIINNNHNINFEKEESLLSENNIIENSDNSIKVNIKGAVVNPGVYSLSAEDRVIDVIEKSGGLLENADTSVINLSKRLFDEMVIIIYTADEIREMKENNVIIQYVEKECDCPSLNNDACITNDKVNVDDSINNIESDNSIKNNRISINTASIEQLQTLSGIGLSKATAIVEYREENGLFSKIEDIVNVSGIGESVFEKIKDNITL